MTSGSLEKNAADLVREVISTNKRITSALVGLIVALSMIILTVIVGNELDQDWIGYTGIGVYGAIIVFCIYIIRKKTKNISEKAAPVGHHMIVNLYGNYDNVPLETLSKKVGITPGERILEFLKHIFPITTE